MGPQRCLNATGAVVLLGTLYHCRQLREIVQIKHTFGEQVVVDCWRPTRAVHAKFMKSPTTARTRLKASATPVQPLR